MKRKTNAFFIILSLILVLISCIGAHLIQTDFGHVTITDVRIPMPSGETLRVLVHRPDTATVDNPAPCVITSHGYHATLETENIQGKYRKVSAPCLYGDDSSLSSGTLCGPVFQNRLPVLEFRGSRGGRQYPDIMAPLCTIYAGILACNIFHGKLQRLDRDEKTLA